MKCSKCEKMIKLGFVIYPKKGRSRIRRVEVKG